MSLNIHKNIIEKLKYFHEMHKIPNIIFNGSSGSGKSTIVSNFISLIYNNDKEKIKNFVMYVNCAHGKGIKFIREELKFFSKTNINSNNGHTFKSIVLLNGDKLTMDAQSALRRCIELFSHNTRFFIIVEDKYKLLKPILSRFCEMYVPEPIYNDKVINLYSYNLEQIYNLKDIKTKQMVWLKDILEKITSSTNITKLVELVIKIYEKGYNALDLINLLEKNQLNNVTINDEKKYELLVTFIKIKKEFRNEKILMLFILNFVYLNVEFKLENISFI